MDGCNKPECCVVMCVSLSCRKVWPLRNRFVSVLRWMGSCNKPVCCVVMCVPLSCRKVWPLRNRLVSV